MISAAIDRRRALLLAGIAWLGSDPVAVAQNPHPTTPAPDTKPDDEPHRLPADVTTHHAIDLPNRTLHFDATAGAIRLTGADLAFVAYQLSGADRARRPVTFAFNGGPGFGSGSLHVGAVGPW